MRIDLQSHSLHSDGALAPAEVVARAAQAGVLGQRDAAGHRQTPLPQVGPPVDDGGMVLHVTPLQPPDRGRAEPEQRLGPVGGIALEIAMQPALARGHGEEIVGPSEMIEADDGEAEPGARADIAVHDVADVDAGAISERRTTAVLFVQGGYLRPET